MFSRKAVAALIGATAIAACGDATSNRADLYDDAVVTLDVATNAGEAIATAIQAMVDNESAASLSSTAAQAYGEPALDLSFSRVRTCYDANGAVVSGCAPMSSVRKIVTESEFQGTRSGSSSVEGGRTRSWSGSVHRESTDTLTRNFNGATEVSRTHSDLTLGHDTTTFTDGVLSRYMTESTIDSIRAVTWNLPRANNPFPVSGTIIRIDTVKVTLSRENRSESRELVRRVQVSFPADAQGNVVLTINNRTCNLNLVTRRVSGCTSA